MTSLEDESKARKERLLSLRRRKAGEAEKEGTGNGYALYYCSFCIELMALHSIILKQRNFDPETRTLRKFDTTVLPEDTIENDVKGLAEKIITEDEERHRQELVSTLSLLYVSMINYNTVGSSQYCS